MNKVKRVVFEAPWTIVFWEDGTMTTALCEEDDAFDAEKGILIAIAKKALGSGKDVRALMDRYIVRPQPVKKPEKPAEEAPMHKYVVKVYCNRSFRQEFQVAEIGVRAVTKVQAVEKAEAIIDKDPLRNPDNPSDILDHTAFCYSVNGCLFTPMEHFDVEIRNKRGDLVMTRGVDTRLGKGTAIMDAKDYVDKMNGPGHDHTYYSFSVKGDHKEPDDIGAKAQGFIEKYVNDVFTKCGLPNMEGTNK